MNLRRTGTNARCPAELQEPEPSSSSWETRRLCVLLRPWTFCFYKGTSATVCQDFSTLPLPFPSAHTETGVVTGGTGKYPGATGTFTLNFKGAPLSLDATGVRVFGWFEDNGVTTITLP